MDYQERNICTLGPWSNKANKPRYEDFWTLLDHVLMIFISHVLTVPLFIPANGESSIKICGCMILIFRSARPSPKASTTPLNRP